MNIIAGALGLFVAAGLFETNLSAQAVPDLYRLTDAVSRQQCEFVEWAIPAGREKVLADLKGPGKITYFYVTDAEMQKYPGLTLNIFWDDSAEPSIRVPLWDFFGVIGGRIADYQSAPMQGNQRCFMSYLAMPFSKRARLVIVNDGDRDYRQGVAYGIDWEEGAAYAQEQSRLHCEWRLSNPVQNGLHTMLEVEGRGQYVRCFLQASVRNPAVWFGEGDTLFHLDGRTAVHSPGTEDEFGCCWGSPEWPS